MISDREARDNSRLWSLIPAILAVLASGGMGFFSTGVNHFWPLAWLMPLPLLIVLPRLRVIGAAVAAAVAATIGALNFILAYDRLPAPVLGVAVLLIAAQFTAVAMAWRAVARRTHPLVAAVAYPALVVTAEYLGSLVSPHGTFGSIAYSQADVLPVIQLAAVTGLWGISFLVSLVPSALAAIWRSRRDPATVKAGLVLAVLPLAAVLGFGAARLASPAPPGEIRIGLAACDASIPYFADTDPSVALPTMRHFADLASALADQGARVAVLPEKFASLSPATSASAYALFASAARGRRVWIVAGFNVREASERRNQAVVFGPDGRVVCEYDKIHLVPGLEEAYRSGSRIGRVQISNFPAGVAICKDLDFVPLGRAHARGGSQLLLAPAWDFGKDGWLHSRMAILRGVEDGFALARCAADGQLTVSDARGRVRGECASGTTPAALLVVRVPVGPAGTFYSRTGDWFAWLCLATTAACLAAGGAAARRRKHGEKPARENVPGRSA